MIEIHDGDYLQGMSCFTCSNSIVMLEYMEENKLIPKEDLHAICFVRGTQGVTVHICTWCIWELQDKLNALGRKKK